MNWHCTGSLGRKLKQLPGSISLPMTGRKLLGKAARKKGWSNVPVNMRIAESSSK